MASSYIKTNATYFEENISLQTKLTCYPSDVLQKHRTHIRNSQSTASNVVDALNVSSSSFLLQVIAAAKRGFRASGFELNPWLVWYSRYKAWREGVRSSTSFHISDLWKVSHSCLVQSSMTHDLIFGKCVCFTTSAMSVAIATFVG